MTTDTQYMHDGHTREAHAMKFSKGGLFLLILVNILIFLGTLFWIYKAAPADGILHRVNFTTTQSADHIENKITIPTIPQ
jgi:archaellum biogenesis protein FlaJ (TadC family)